METLKSAQYLRYAQLLIQSDKITIDVSNLNFTFNTKMGLINVPKVLQVRIFNVAPNTIKQIMEEGMQIQLSAGYVEGYGVIFSGQIRQISIGKENGTDTFLDIQATDNDALFKGGFVNTNIAAGSSENSRLSHLTAVNNISKVELNNAIKDNGSTLPRGRVYYGSLKKHLHTITSQMGGTFFTENGQLNVVPTNGYLNDAVIEINRGTGMIGLPTQTLQGIQVKCLLNPNLKVGCAIKLDNSSVQIAQQNFGVKEEPLWELNLNPLNGDGIYKVISIAHEGQMRGNPWFTNVICYTIGKSTPNQIPFLGQ